MMTRATSPGRYAAAAFLTAATIGVATGAPTPVAHLEHTHFKYPILRVEDAPAGRGANPRPTPRRMVGDHIIVRPRRGVTAAQLRDIAAALGGHIRKRLRTAPVYLVAFDNPTPDTVPDAVRAFNRHTDVVAYAECDLLGQLDDTVPDDPYFTNGSLWALSRIAAPAAWDANTGNTGTVVAVIDTGIDLTHPDLAANIWTNPGESGTDALGRDRATNGVDDDNNGFVDDVHGWDFYNDDADPTDGQGHGTRCAGHIGAVGNNALGVVGVCWHVGLMGLKMWSDSGETTLSDAVESFNYVTMMRTNGANVRVVSTSWGFTPDEVEPQSLYEAMQAAADAGILCAASAGNDSRDIDAFPRYPACFALSNLIVAAASTSADTRYSSSNYGITNVDLAAPGSGIWSTAPNGTYLPSSGTSRSAPFVAGVAALVWDLYPELTCAHIRDAILAGADPVPAFATITATGGRLSALNTFLRLPPRIEHAPLLNTTNTLDTYTVQAAIRPVALLDTNSAVLVWRRADTGENWITNSLFHLSNAVFGAEIPAQPRGAVIEYRLRAANTNGVANTVPPPASAAPYRFQVVPPVSLTVLGTPDTVGAVTPYYGSHTYPSGITVHASAPPVVPTADDARFVANGWTGTGSTPLMGDTQEATFTIDAPSTLTWQWQQEFALSHTSSIPGLLTATTWGAANTTVDSIAAPARAALGGTNYCFAEWRVNGNRNPDATNTAANPATDILMSTSRVAVAVYLPEAADLDADGLRDWWERYHFGNPTNTPPDDDPDDDAFSNLAEQADGTNPRDTASYPRPPEIAHTPLHTDQAFPPPYEVVAAITDNYAVAAATLLWQRVAGPLQHAEMSPRGPALNVTAAITNAARDGDAFTYRIEARDAGGNTRTNGPYLIVYRAPRIESARRELDTAPPRLVLGWHVQPELSYILQAAPALIPTPAWTDVTDALPPPGPDSYQSHTTTVSDAADRFYRLRVNRPISK